MNTSQLARKPGGPVFQRNGSPVHLPPNPRADKHLQEEELSEAIVEYLAEHPRASDTLEGIAEWWIMRQHIRAEIKMLAKVLRRLTKTGRLGKVGKGDEALYHL